MDYKYILNEHDTFSISPISAVLMLEPFYRERMGLGNQLKYFLYLVPCTGNFMLN